MDDLISRQMAIEVVQNRHIMLNKEKVLLINDLEKLPSAQPEIKQQAINSSDCIDRQAALDALRKMQTYKLFSGDDMLLIDQAGAQTELMLLPSVQPAIVPCDYAKACNEVSMNRITSAVVYMEILEDFKEYGYVLVDMREVTT